MANIRVDVDYTIKDGTEIKFRSPVDCSAITGLKVYYLGASGTTASKTFVLADAHGNNVGNIDHLFAEDVVVKVILDVTKGMAFVQNADTNAYLENKFAGKAPAGYGYGEIPVSLGTADNDTAFLTKLNEQFALTASKTRQVLFTMGGVTYIGTLWNAGNGYGTLTANSYTDAETAALLTKIVRNRVNGNWHPWEYENPPLKNNTEYRTTERYGSKPVYVKRINYGALAVAKTTVTIPLGALGAETVVDYSIMLTKSNGNIFKYPSFGFYDGSVWMSAYIDNTNNVMQLYTHTDMTTFTAVVIVKYTKA